MVKGWAKKSIGELGTFSKGSGVSRTDANSGKLPCIRYGEIYTIHNDYIKSFSSHISSKVAQTAKLLKHGDLLFTGSGETKEEIGKCVAFIDNFEAYAGGDIIILSPDRDIDPLFMGFMLNTPSVAKQKASKGQGDAIVHITAKALGDIIVFVPPLPEQRAIATVLSDMDNYITALEKLITKKRIIKQGAMQELLTGKRRLPGYSGEWVEKRLDEFGTFISGDCFPLIYQGGHVGYSFYKVSDFSNQGNERIMTCANNYITLDIAALLNCNLIPKNAIVFAKIGAAVFLERKRIVNSECCVDNNMMAFITNETIGNANYICYLMQTISFGDLVTATALPSLNAKSIGEIIKPFPPVKDEQAAIAEVLSDMDSEIDALRAKLNKAKHIKQGMVRELLTGRIRLIDTESNKPADEAYPKAKNKPAHKTEEQPIVKGHNQQFDDAVMIAGIVNVLYHEKYLLGRKKVQKCLYLLRRHQNESTKAFKKKAAGPYADEVRYKGGEPIAKKSGYIDTTTSKQGTTFSRGKNISQALGYIKSWGKQDDIQWVAVNLRFKKVDELELLATVDMASCDLKNNGVPITVQSIKHLIETNKEWKAKLEKQIFSDTSIDRAIKELQTLLKGGN